MTKTVNRAYLRRLIERGRIEMVGSYHFDDMAGESRFKDEPLPVFIGEYGQSKDGYCMLFASDLTSSGGSARLGDNGNIHLRVHSNCSYDFRLLDIK